MRASFLPEIYLSIYLSIYLCQDGALSLGALACASTRMVQQQPSWSPPGATTIPAAGDQPSRSSSPPRATTIPGPPAGPPPSFANSASFVRRYKTVPPVSAVGGAFTEEALRMQQLGVWRAGEKTLRERKASSDRDMVEAARAHEAAKHEWRSCGVNWGARVA